MPAKRSDLPLNTPDPQVAGAQHHDTTDDDETPRPTQAPRDASETTPTPATVTDTATANENTKMTDADSSSENEDDIDFPDPGVMILPFKPISDDYKYGYVSRATDIKARIGKTGESETIVDMSQELAVEKPSPHDTIFTDTGINNAKLDRLLFHGYIFAGDELVYIRDDETVAVRIIFVGRGGFIQLRPISPDFSLAPYDPVADPIVLSSPEVLEIVFLEMLNKRANDRLEFDHKAANRERKAKGQKEEKFKKPKPVEIKPNNSWSKINVYRRYWAGSLREAGGWYYDEEGKPLPRGKYSYLSDRPQEVEHRKRITTDGLGHGVQLIGTLSEVREKMAQTSMKYTFDDENEQIAKAKAAKADKAKAGGQEQKAEAAKPKAGGPKKKAGRRRNKK